MITNSISNNQYSIPSVNTDRSLSSESAISSANIMPTTTRPILEANSSRKISNNFHNNLVKKIYNSNDSSSHGSLTESFLRSRASLSPTYMHNEIITRYNMISAIPVVLSQIKKAVDKVA